MPVYVDHIADRYDDLLAGKPVDVAPSLLRGIAEVPPGCWLVRVDVDGTISPAPYERLTSMPTTALDLMVKFATPVPVEHAAIGDAFTQGGEDGDVATAIGSAGDAVTAMGETPLPLPRG